MLRYSELSKPQQKIIDEMRQGHELRFYFDGLKYAIHTDTAEIKVKNNSADGLRHRNFIKRCHVDNLMEIYCVNIEIIYPENFKDGK